MSVRREGWVSTVPRDADADYRKSIEDAIAVYEQQGLQPTEHLLNLRAEYQRADAEVLENKSADTELELAIPEPSQTARRRTRDRSAD